MAISRVTFGNDFTIRINVVQPQYTIDGTIYEDFDITKCSDVKVCLICEQHKVVIPLSWTIEENTNNIILADIIGKQLHVGSVYGVQITGLDENNKAWRYKNKSVFSVVDATKDSLMDVELMDEPLELRTEISLFVNAIPIEGHQGAQGTQGVQGSQGERGERGLDGAPGVQGTQGVQGSQGERGERGLDGAPGVQGSQGAQGQRGLDGAPGPAGPQGERGQDGSVYFDDLTPEQKEELRGPQGDTGAQGDKGDTGAQGDKGDTGAQGDKGDTGAQGDKGDIGPQGEQGLMGEQGPQGDKGDTGAQGDKGDIGPQGEQGLMGAQGPQGDKGDTGAQGDKGDTGAQGDKGDTGAQGDKGDTGAQGDKGDRGYQGFQGTQGLEGQQGPRGFTGDSGIVDLYNEAVALGLYDGTLEDFTDTFLEWGYSGYQASNELLLKQDNLVSGQNIKTINNESILGSGNITIPSGAQGERGEQGQAGPQGERGEQGQAGPQGERGEQGERGLDGQPGVQGSQGERGETGAQGDKGDAGPQGNTGAQGSQGEKGDGADIDIEPAKIVIDEQMPSNPDPEAVYMISHPINITPYPSLSGSYNSGTYTLFLGLYDQLNKKLFHLGEYVEENNLTISLITRGSIIEIYLNAKWAYTLDVYFKTPSSTSPATITDGSVQLNNAGDIEFRIEGSASDLGIDLHLSTGYWATNINYSLNFDPFGTISTVISHS